MYEVDLEAEDTEIKLDNVKVKSFSTWEDSLRSADNLKISPKKQMATSFDGKKSMDELSGI